jgi:hypothetical protein
MNGQCMAAYVGVPLSNSVLGGTLISLGKLLVSILSACHRTKSCDNILLHRRVA